MANEMLTGMLSQPKGPSAPRPQQPGLQNQTNNAQWWKGGAGGAQPQQAPQMATNPYGGTVPTGAPAPMGATSGYGSSTPTPPPPPPPPTGTPPPTGGGTWGAATPMTPQQSAQAQMDRMMNDIYRHVSGGSNYYDQLQRTAPPEGGRYSGTAKDIAERNKTYARRQASLDNRSDTIRKMLETLRGFDSSDLGAGYNPMAELEKYFGTQGGGGQWWDTGPSAGSQMYGGDWMQSLLGGLGPAPPPPPPRMTPPGYVNPAGAGASLGGPTFGGGPPIPPKGGGRR